MANRSKKALFVVVALLVIIGGGIFYLVTQLDVIVASQIEKHGSAATQTPVRVAGVSIDLKDASAGLSGLTVGNPEGFDGGNAIELGDFNVSIDPSSIRSDTIVLKEVLVTGARLNVLQRGAASNLKTLLDNLRGNAEATPEESGGSTKKVVIERFVLDDAQASVSIPDLDEDRSVTIPTIELTDIGRASNGATVSQATRQILEPILQRTMQTAAAQALQDRASEEVDKAKDKLLEGVMDRIGGKDEDENSQN